MSAQSYASRAEIHPTVIGRHLLSIISSKRTNLCLSIDVTSPTKVLDIVGTLAPKICLVKTHIDILTFPPDSPLSIPEFTSALSSLAKEHNFLIFEDRKFADIGNTVSHQYGGGIYRIADWAHITNAHSLPGEGIIHGLQKVADALPLSPQGQPEDTARGLLLLEEMSSAGNLFNSSGYRSSTLEMARRNKNFVMGFIAMGKVGITGDALGQQYKTPEYVIRERGSDVIIVGRGIYESEDMLGTAEEYRRRGWEAYENRIKA
ncbi:Orotidine 5'-phosphate decarboxylase domain-containing protein [Terfezia claveryi]|nr:Orotidine 5'-phosphate decarboxylase domain-containing protein [Terfezia claveryi]